MTATAALPGLRERLGGLLPDRADLRTMRQAPGRDLLAGLTVAVVALPLALAFGVGSGLGAAAGLATAVVAGVLAAVFGGSNLQVSGPTGAMTVVLLPIVAQHGPGGVLIVGFLAGVILVALALARAGGYAAYLPLPVLEGFTAGIAVVIALQQIPAALGVDGLDGEQVWLLALRAAGAFLADPDPAAPLLALAVAGAVLAGARLWPTAPLSLPVVIIATLAVPVADLNVTGIGDLPPALPAPSLDFLDLGTVPALLPAAVAVAALAALESLLCASVADAMRGGGERHHPDRELFGQGVANLVTPMFGGVPATAAIARTMVNVRSGARSRLAAITHAAVIAVVVFTASGLVAHIPLAALAGVLLATTVRMIDLRALRAIARATRGDAVVMAVTFTVTVAVDLVTAVLVGAGAAGVLALRAVAGAAGLRPVPPRAARQAGGRPEDGCVAAYHVDGPLFFATAHRLLGEFTEPPGARVVVLGMSRVRVLDATGVNVLGQAVARLAGRGVAVLLAEVRPEHDRMLSRLEVTARLRRDGRVLPDLPAALTRARDLLDSAPVGGGRSAPA